MSQQYRANRPARGRGHGALNRLHPELLELMQRTSILPPGDLEDATEDTLARSAALALSLVDEDEQASIVSRIMSDQEIARARLTRPEVQDLNQRIVLDTLERGVALASTSESEEEEQSDNGCIICGDPGNVRISCNHLYCLRCLFRNARVGLSSVTNFPPRCCNPLTEADIRLLNRPELVHLYRQLASEADTPALGRLYCHDVRCATFIPPDAHGTCPVCGKQTCAQCKARAHPGQRCGDLRNGERQDNWELMDRNGFVNCPGCGIIVELYDGCNHMTCPCSTQFCYLCGQIWDTCRCPDYNHLELRVPIRDRPGIKPERWTYNPRPESPTGSDNLYILPQLRSRPGEEPWIPPRREDTRPEPAHQLAMEQQAPVRYTSPPLDLPPVFIVPAHDNAGPYHPRDLPRQQANDQRHPIEDDELYPLDSSSSEDEFADEEYPDIYISDGDERREEMIHVRRGHGAHHGRHRHFFGPNNRQQHHHHHHNHRHDDNRHNRHDYHRHGGHLHRHY